MSETETTPQRGTGVGVQERPTTVPTDAGDHERFAHIIFSPGRNAEAVILEARVTGSPVTALCGKKWVPERDPKRYPICPTCKEIRERGGR